MEAKKNCKKKKDYKNRLNNFKSKEKFKADKRRYVEYVNKGIEYVKTVQYSKILTTSILIFTIMINAFYMFVIVPFSGQLMITDAAFESLNVILLAWNAGTILFFMGYFAKSLFETKWQEQIKTVNKFRTSEVKEDGKQNRAD